MTAIADSAPLIFLAAVSQFELLRLYFSSLLIPGAVYQEVVAEGGQRPGARETEEGIQAGWIAIADPRETPDLMFLLDRGMTRADAHIIALAQERQADLLLSDDASVRTQARMRGLPATGTLGILLKARRDNHLPSLQAVLGQLVRAGFYLQPEGSVYKELLRRAGEATE